MSLFSTISVGSNALSAAQFGLQVVGNNIANASTPGYIRQDVLFKPAPSYRVGSLVFGLGVQVEAVVQRIDKFLAERLRNADSDLANGEAQETTYTQLEALIAELGDNDLSTTLNNFFGSINDLLNQPEDTAIRNLAVLQGNALTDEIRRLDSGVRALHKNVNDQVTDVAQDVNRLVRTVADLNLKIVSVEGGGAIKSDAVSLRDGRQLALNELATFIDIRSVEQPSGSVSVYAEGEYLVFEGIFREVKAVQTPGADGLPVAEIRFVESDSKISSSAGKLAGRTIARDEIVNGFLDQLHDFTRSLIYEFNKVYASGQGFKGYSALTSEFAVDDSTAALDQAGLQFTPVNGSLQVQVQNSQTNAVKTTDIFIELDGLGNDTSLDDLATALNNIDGIAASVTGDRNLNIASDSKNIEFSFANDTSGILAALGLNTFFTGSSALDINVDSVVRNDPRLFATSRAGIGLDTEIAADLASFLNAPLESGDGASLAELYDQLVSSVSQGASVTKAVTAGYRSFQQTLESQHLAISGVNIDEEAIKMITLQRSFQASAKLIVTVSELMETLINL